MPCARQASRIVEPAGTRDGLRRRSSARPAAGPRSAAAPADATAGPAGRAGSAGSAGVGRAAATGGRSQRHQLRLPERALDRGARRLAEAADDASRIAWPMSREERELVVARSPRGRPAARRASSSSWRTVPTRHGTHWPHDSSRKNWAIRRSVPTRSAVSSKTITTPEPSVAPIARVASNVSGMSSASGPDEDAGRAAEQHRLEGAAARDAAGERRAARAASPRTRPRRRRAARRCRRRRRASGRSSPRCRSP